MPSQSGVRAGRAFIEYNMKDNLTRKMARVQKSLRKFGMAMVKIGGLVTAALTASVVAFTKIGDKLDKMSKRTGVAVEALSRLAFAAEQSGASLDTVEKGIKAMQRTLLDASWGLSTATDAMKALGLNVDALRKMKPEAQFRAFGEALSKIESPSDRAALALKVFGRAGQELLPLLEGGAAGIAALEREADALGRTMTEEQAAQAAELADAWNRLKSSFQATAVLIGGTLAPALQKLIDKMTELTMLINEPGGADAWWKGFWENISQNWMIKGTEMGVWAEGKAAAVPGPDLSSDVPAAMAKKKREDQAAKELAAEDAKKGGALYLGLQDAVMSGVEDGMKAAQDALTVAKSGMMGFGALKLDALFNAQRAAPAAMSSAGTFNAAALASISHGGIATPAEEKTAKNTERMIQLLNSILRELREGGLAFS